MINGFNVGREYNIALNGYAAEKRTPTQMFQFRETLRNASRIELKEWYELYRDPVITGKTYKIKKKPDSPK